MIAPDIVGPAGVLDQALGQASPDLMRSLLQTMVNALLSADADAVCGAEYGQAGPEHRTQRNGYRHRDLDTRVRTIDVAVPKLRTGSYFPDWLLERRKRAESWESYVSGWLFTPLGMEHTTLIAGQSEIPDGAIHGVQANGRRSQSLSGPGSIPAGAGVWSTPEDMTRYAQAVLTGTVPGGAAPQEARWPAEVLAGVQLPGERVGYTWYTDVVDGHTIIGHGGTTMEYMTHLAIDKESGKAVMVYTDQNTDGTAVALSAMLLADGQKILTARLLVLVEILLQGMILGIFTALALVMGLYTAARAASAPSRMAVVCRVSALHACLAAAAASGP